MHLLLNIFTETKIAMTVPVSTKVEPAESDKFRFQMGFYIPKEFQENPPKPTDDRVHVVERDLKVYSM
jgi:SOUL heme-binding protein